MFAHLFKIEYKTNGNEIKKWTEEKLIHYTKTSNKIRYFFVFTCFTLTEDESLTCLKRGLSRKELRMKKADVKSKAEIKQLLCLGNVLGIKNDKYRSFGGFQLWWYDKHLDICDCCESYWSDVRKRVHHYSLNKATRILWHNRQFLYLRTKHLPEDKKLMTIGHFETVGQ